MQVHYPLEINKLYEELLSSKCPSQTICSYQVSANMSCYQRNAIMFSCLKSIFTGSRLLNTVRKQNNRAKRQSDKLGKLY